MKCLFCEFEGDVEQLRLHLMYCEEHVAAKMLKDLLAVIHRDGGHMTKELGIPASIKLAEKKYLALIDKLEGIN